MLFDNDIKLAVSGVSDSVPVDEMRCKEGEGAKETWSRRICSAGGVWDRSVMGTRNALG